MKMPVAVVTGGAGFIGRNVTRALIRGGYSVYANDPRFTNDDLNPFSTVALERDRGESVCRWFEDPPKVAIHAAANVGGREGIDNQPLWIMENAETDRQFFKWALQARPDHVVYFSSPAGYPTYSQMGPTAVKLDETDWSGNPSLADGAYGACKVWGEHLAHWARSQGLNVHILRPFSGYGTDQHETYPFPAIIQRVRLREDPLHVWGSGNQVRDFIHVDDIVAAIMGIVDADLPNVGPVQLGTTDGTSMRELARMAAELAGYEPTIIPLPAKPSGVDYRVAADTYVIPTVTLSEGIVRALEGRL